MFSKILNFKNGLQFYTLLIIISAIVFAIAVNKKPYIAGDGPEYYMMAESFVNHATLDMKEQDINSVEVKSHKFKNKRYYGDSTNIGGYFKSLNGTKYSYHFWAYSLLTVPAKHICNLLEIDDLQSFQLTNAILFILMIWLLYFRLKLPEGQKNALILLLIFNPILYYLDWAHTEVFTYVFAVLALMSYINRSYKTSYVLMAIASWQNPPVIFFSLLIFLVHSFQYFKQKSYKNIILEGLSLSLFLLPMIFYFYNYRVLNLIAANGGSSIHNISWDKIWDLYFGLQHGMILFSAVILMTFFFVIIETFRQKKFTKTNIVLLLSIVSMSIVVTTAPNWNCGMEFIIRYAVWIYAFIVYYVVLNMEDSLKLKIITIANTLFFLIIFLIYTNFSHVKFNELSKFVLNNAPSVYITTKDTFRENILHRETGLNYKKPIIYMDEEKNYRKILIDYKGLKKLVNDSSLSIDKQYKEKLMNEYQSKEGSFFINVPKGKIRIYFEIKPLETISFDAKNIIFSGWSHAESTHRWSLNKKSSIEFDIKNINKVKGVLRLHIGTLGKQKIKVFINAHYIGDQIRNSGDTNISFKFDKNLLLENKLNTISFEFPNAHKPNNGDQRVLAIALKSFSIE